MSNIARKWSFGRGGLHETNFIADTPYRGRPNINGVSVIVRLPHGGLDCIKAVLAAGETQTDFIREAIVGALNERYRSLSQHHRKQARRIAKL